MKTQDSINEEALNLYIHLIGKMYAKTMSYDLDFIGLDRYFTILWAINEGSERLTQQNLSDLFKVDKAAMVRIIDELSRKGFVERIENPHDRRAYHLALTRKGKKVIPNIQEALRNLNDEALLDFSQEERESFLSMLHRMYQNLTHLPESDFFLNFEKLKQSQQNND